MQFKKYTKQRNASIQGLRSLKDTLPNNIKKVISKRGHVYSEILNNWKLIVGKDLFQVCFPKSYKNSNKFGVSKLLIMVKRGHEVELEYSKNKIINNMTAFFGNSVVEKIKFVSFNSEKEILSTKINKENVTKNKYQKKITNVKNDKIRKSLQELTRVYREK